MSECYIDLEGNKEWWINGKRHRDDGPAIEYANGDKEWWLNDKKCTEDDFILFQFTNYIPKHE